MLTLSRRKHPLLHEQKAVFRHFRIFLRCAFLVVEEFLVAFAAVGNAAFVTPTAVTVITAHFKSQMKIFVPKLLLLGEEDVGPLATTAFSFQVVVVRDAHRRKVLLAAVSFDGGLRNVSVITPTGLYIKTGEPGTLAIARMHNVVLILPSYRPQSLTLHRFPCAHQPT